MPSRKIPPQQREAARQQREAARLQDRDVVVRDNSPITKEERAYWLARWDEEDDRILELWGAVVKQAMDDRDTGAVKRLANLLGLDRDVLLEGIGRTAKKRAYHIRVR